MTNRRKFLKEMAIIGAMSTSPQTLISNLRITEEKKMIWGLLLHLSFNMWEEYISDAVPITKIRGYRPYLDISENLWNDALNEMAKEGMNMVVIDLGNAVKYQSHPEIAVKNAWSVDRLAEELEKIRHLGIEPIPKLNFSAGHDTWLQSYSRMLSTSGYYEVCSDLIQEVSELFNKPRFFHLGMDEETANNQRYYDYVAVRQNELWWGDFYFLIGEVEKNGARPWIWSDYLWHHPDLFFKNMPGSVMQSNWYYDADFSTNITGVKAYVDLEKHGFDQIPTTSNWGRGDWKSKNGQENMINTVKFSKQFISENRLFGFLQTSWLPTKETYRDSIINSIQLAGKAKDWYLNQKK